MPDHAEDVGERLARFTRLHDATIAMNRYKEQEDAREKVLIPLGAGKNFRVWNGRMMAGLVVGPDGVARRPDFGQRMSKKERNKNSPARLLKKLSSTK